MFRCLAQEDWKSRPLILSMLESPASPSYTPFCIFLHFFSSLAKMPSAVIQFMTANRICSMAVADPEMTSIVTMATDCSLHPERLFVGFSHLDLPVEIDDLGGNFSLVQIPQKKWLLSNREWGKSNEGTKCNSNWSLKFGYLATCNVVKQV